MKGFDESLALVKFRNLLEEIDDDLVPHLNSKANHVLFLSEVGKCALELARWQFELCEAEIESLREALEGSAE